MDFKFLFGYIFFYMPGAVLFAQSKKDISKNKIRSVTENVVLYGKGKETSYKESYTLFNKAGKVLEEVNYNLDGSIHKRDAFKYDNDKNKIEEVVYKEAEDERKKPAENKKTISKYNKNGDKIEETEYDGTGKMLGKTIYAYNNFGEKVSELHYDGGGIVNKKVKYTYDNKSLKTTRESFLSDNTLESIKKYAYEFY
jgi:hypothetical protein